MKLPNEIVFGSRIIKLEFIDKELADKKKIFGEFHSDDNKILIDISLKPIDTTNTALHELFHMLMNEYQINLKAKDEELVCSSLANGICHTLYQNQELLEFLYKSLKK
jgi:Zn-dependent peptidase ImmA (M78 family)